LYTVMLQDFTSLRVIIVVVFAAVFGSIIGLTAYIKGQAGIEASEAGLFTYLQPVISIPLAVILLGEKIGGFEIAAMLLILSGVWIAERKRA
ncbi:EamA family transporter, partial [Candidatus Woesebacteria bacterium]|nr:EamA family transporter [Candidatus Woesebacteria bacterium]